MLRSRLATTTTAATGGGSRGKTSRSAVTTGAPDMAQLLNALLVDANPHTGSSAVVDDNDTDADAHNLLNWTLGEMGSHACRRGGVNEWDIEQACHSFTPYQQQQQQQRQQQQPRSGTAELLAVLAPHHSGSGGGGGGGGGGGSVITVDPSIECAASSDIPFEVNMDALPNVLDVLHTIFQEFALDIEQLLDEESSAQDNVDAVAHSAYVLWAGVVADCLRNMRAEWLAPTTRQYASVQEFSSFIDRLVHSPNTMGYTLERYCDMLDKKCTRAHTHPRYTFSIVHHHHHHNNSASDTQKAWTVTLCSILPGVHAACFFEPLDINATSIFGHNGDSGATAAATSMFEPAALFRLRGCVFFPDAVSEASSHLLMNLPAPIPTATASH